MAKNEGTKGAVLDPQGESFDWNAFAGSDADGMVKTGGLIPMYSWEDAIKEKWNPALGKLLGIAVLPEVESPDGKRRPLMYVMLLTKATKAKEGSAEDRITVDVAAGKQILVPINGNLESNVALHLAALDPQNVYTVGFRATGEEKKLKGRPTPMKVIEMMMKPEPEKRVGNTCFLQSKDQVIAHNLFEVYGRPVPDALAQGFTSHGQQFNRQTGELTA